ncbi:MAG: hypothetical protein AAB443_00500 [Patescibacteria group bacterium]
MSNLTRTSKVARVSINVTVISLVLYSIIYFSFPGIVKTLTNLFPKEEKANFLFGTLPKIKFNSFIIGADTTPTYELNTPTGRLPSDITKKLFNVYKVVQPTQSFSAGKQAQAKAQKFAFTDNELASGLTGNIYKWIDTKRSRTLEINIVTNTMNLNTNLSQLEGRFLNDPRLTDEAQPANLIGRLREFGFFQDPLYQKRGVPRIIYGKYFNGRIEETTTPQDYTFAKLDVFRTVFQVPIVGPRYDEGLLGVTIAKPKDDQDLKIVKLTAHEWTIVTDLTGTKIGTYPTLSVDEAWKQVTLNKGFFSKLKLRKTGSQFEAYQPISIARVSIEKVYLAYFDSWEYQEVMQPIYVFQGTFNATDGNLGDVAIYYPAIHPSYIKQ